MIQLEVVPPDYNEHSTWIATARRSGRQIQHPRDPVLISSVSQTNVSFEFLTLPIEFYLSDLDVESLIRIRIVHAF